MECSLARWRGVGEWPGLASWGGRAYTEVTWGNTATPEWGQDAWGGSQAERMDAQGETPSGDFQTRLWGRLWRSFKDVYKVKCNKWWFVVEYWLQVT